MALANAIQGAKRPSQNITWKREDGTPEDLTGATITGKLLLRGQLAATSISGTFTVVDGPNGVFRWDYGTSDVATAGTYKVQFVASFGADPTPAKTFITEWVVVESL